MEGTQGGDNVFEDVGFDPGEAASLKVRADLMLSLRKYIEAKGWTQSQAAAFLGEFQPRISNLMRGEIGRFSVDKLINMLTRAGMQAEFYVKLQDHKAMVMDFTGYRQAVIHIAWFRDDNVRHLLFGMVELRPNEFVCSTGCSPKNFRVGNKDRKYLHYRRFALPVEDAIKWYRCAADGNPILPRDPNHPTQGDCAELQVSEFVPAPPWPHFITSNELVFAPDWMQDSRTHFLFPKNVLSREVNEIIRIDKNRAKLEEWLNFDIVDAYREYQGAICLVAPNPLFRSTQKTHLEKAKEGTDETVAYKLVARQGQRLDGLRLEIVNEHLRERMTPLVHEFDNDAIAVFDFPVKIDKEALSITHPEYGLLAWNKPLPVLRSIHMTMELLGRRKVVQVPDGGRKWPRYEYEVDEVEDERQIVVGDALEDADIVRRIAEEEKRRSRQKDAKDYDQQWFYRTPSEAAQYVREKIGSARNTVLIVDPYFAGRELLAFGHAVSRPDIDSRILTSTSVFDANSGAQLLDTLDRTFESYPTKPEVRILTGDPPPIHDRFLIVDGAVWFSGNSLHTIGERAGMIVKLLDPEPVIARLDAFWRKAPTLSDWLSNQPTTVAPRKTSSGTV